MRIGLSLVLVSSFLISGARAQMKIESSEILAGMPLTSSQILEGFGCHGLNVSPEVSWQAEPNGTRSFAITFYDPDAPTGSGWWHWTVFNIPATIHRLPQGAGGATNRNLPEGAQMGRTDFGNAYFGGACPPVGDAPHRYQLTVWALGVDRLPLDAQASGAMVGFFLNQYALSRATVTAHYGR